MRNDWDEAKRRGNIAKHGIDFAALDPVFAGRMLVRIDARRDYGEVRKVGIGMLGNYTVSIAWAEHRGFRWIISARRASAKERKAYESLEAAE